MCGLFCDECLGSDVGNATAKSQHIFRDFIKPRPYWHELRDQLGERVTTEIVPDASHALFPEQPDKVVDLVIPWFRSLIAQ
jgi:pimeloyl-ACP methyl ester carboxylesterase